MLLRLGQIHYEHESAIKSNKTNIRGRRSGFLESTVDND